MTGPRPVVLAHVSDLHLGAHSATATAALVADVAAARPAVTVVTGDVTMRARPEQFRAACALMRRLPSPVLVVAGNHDIPLTNPFARAISPYEGFASTVDSELDPVLEVDGVRVQGLASAVPWRWKAGRVSPRQVDRVVAVLGAPGPVLRVLALHHPLTPGLLGRDRLVRALTAARVDLVLAGHAHVPGVHQVTVPGGGTPVQVVAGTAVSTRTRGDVGQSWTLVVAGPDTVTVTHRYLRGARWEAGAPVRFALSASAPSA
jgi:3',5'-cyclic AMP phosphodiesterase CpdA